MNRPSTWTALPPTPLTETMTEALAEATVLLITHRLLGIEAYDTILVIEDGRISAQGRHDDLMNRGGWYADQWRLESERQDMARLVPQLPVGRAVPAP